MIAAMLVLAGGALALGIMVGPMSESQAQAASNDPVFYNELGYQLAQAGDSAGAQTAFSRALALKPDYENARSNLATIAFQNKEYMTAAANLRVLVEQHPYNPQYRFDLAQNLASQARYNDADLAKLQEAAEEFEQADALQPGFPHAKENAAILRQIVAEYS
jgi:Flp pilus assembly protein TadD